jgi:hypothetical protein
MPDRVGVSAAVKRVIQLECVRPLIGSYPGVIVFSFRTITCLYSERSLRRPCLLAWNHCTNSFLPTSTETL